MKKRFALRVAAVLALCASALGACGAPQPAANANASAQLAPTATRKAPLTPAPQPRPARMGGLRVVSVSELPREAQRTVALIERGGPFPFEKDGSTFQNRERILPNKPRGYYREYTVITPGEDDRGARRIIAGQAGELYYTADHYDSFVRVVEP